ncbi:MAG: hypothetical protein CMM73_01400 [Rhodospirillaceae bacterium]|nr:hypothetical protein [Rhodospirillaceae bacterium]|tara:strand:- start:1714 stop:2262 length:549 start_codon:yes stop_codon:yes gene_type:complete
MTGSGRHPDDDTSLWQKVTRGVTPYNQDAELTAAKSAIRSPSREKQKKNIKESAARLAVAPKQPKPIDVSAGEHAGIDRASRRRLVQGNLEIGARLDLHGMTAAQAERSLARFIDSASTAHHRCVLVITGKGRGGQGVLRRLVPKWLKTSPLSGRILAISNATQADGGEGALYVMLRRTRNL